MEWYIMNTSGVRSLTQTIGRPCAENGYQLSDDCADTLEDIINLVETDDKLQCTNRRHLLAENIVPNDLVKLIQYTVPDQNELCACLKLLSELCFPLEVYLPHNAAADVTKDVQKLLRQVRFAFINTEFVKKLFQHIHSLISEAGEYEMSCEGYQCLHEFLQLIRNIMHAVQKEDLEQRIALTGIILKCNLSSILLYSLNCHSRDSLSLPAVQVIAQLFQNFQWNYTYSNPSSPLLEKAVHMISDQLKCFTVQLLQGTLGQAVSTLRKLMVRSTTDAGELDTYYNWLLAFFLPFLSEASVPLSKLRNIFNGKCVGYLVYQAAVLSLELRLNGQEANVHPGKLASINSIFCALDALFRAGLRFAKQCTSNEDFQILLKFYESLYNMADLRSVILVYIRLFDVTLFSKSFLAQLVCLNHQLLSCMEFYVKITKRTEDHIISHVQRFATAELMSKYGILLSSYMTNTDETNSAVFTLLCHVCLDCSSVCTLYQPEVLRPLYNISQSEVSPCTAVTPEDQQLSKYVIDSFLQDLSSDPEKCVSAFMDQTPVCPSNQHLIESIDSLHLSSDGDDVSWGEEAENDLLSLYALHSESHSSSWLAVVTRELNKHGHTFSEQEIHRKLACHGVCGELPSQSQEQISEKIRECVVQLSSCDCEDIINWIQHSLLALSQLKASQSESRCTKEPVCFFSHKFNRKIPIIPYTQRQEVALHGEQVRQLLKYLGLSVPGSLIPQIDVNQTDKDLFELAQCLAPVEKAPLSGSTSSIESISDEDCLKVTQSMPEVHARSRISLSHGASSDSNVWLKFMKKSS